MKICHITTVHSLKDTRIFRKELCSLSKEPYETFYIVPHGKKETINNVNIIPLLKIHNRFFRMFFSPINALIKAIRVNAYVYHFHDPELIFIGLVLKILGKKVIYDVHEDVPRQILSKHYFNKNIAHIISKVFERIENFCAKFFNYIITATPFINERFFKINKNSININNYPVIKDEFFRKEKDFKELDNIICYVGGITEERGIKTIIESLEDINNVKLILVGSFSSQSFKNECEKLKAWGKVDYLGQVDYEQVFKIMKKSKIGICLLKPIINYIDSLPIKIFEYMMAGLPIICSNFKLWEEIVEDGNCGICVNPNSKKEISKQINKLIQDYDTLTTMSKNGKNLILEKYNWRTDKKKLIKIYNEFC